MNETVLVSSPVVSLYFFIGIAMAVGFLFFVVLAAIVVKFSTQKDNISTVTNLALILFLVGSVSLSGALSYHQYTYSSQASETLSIFDYTKDVLPNGDWHVTFMTQTPVTPILVVDDITLDEPVIIQQTEKSDIYNHEYIFSVSSYISPVISIQIEESSYTFNE